MVKIFSDFMLEAFERLEINNKTKGDWQQTDSGYETGLKLAAKLAEETGEVTRCALHDDFRGAYQEAVDVAATAFLSWFHARQRIEVVTRRLPNLEPDGLMLHLDPQGKPVK